MRGRGPMSDRTDSIEPADNERRWQVEQTITVEVGGQLVDRQEGRTLTAVTIRMPAFAAAHLAAGLAVLAHVADLITQSAYDETEMVKALQDAARVADLIDQRLGRYNSS